MTDRVNPAQLLGSLATLRGYLDDLDRASFQEHATKLRLFVNYFQKDDQLRVLAERLRTRLGDVVAAAQSPSPRLPDDTRDRLAFVWGVLFHLKVGKSVEIRELLTRAFEGASLDQKWTALRDRWLRPFSESLAALEQAVAARAGGELVDPDVVFTAALESLAPEPTAAERLRASVATVSPPASGDVQLELEILALELEKRRRDSKRVAEIVGGLERSAPQIRAVLEAGGL